MRIYYTKFSTFNDALRASKGGAKRGAKRGAKHGTKQGAKHKDL